MSAASRRDFLKAAGATGAAALIGRGGALAGPCLGADIGEKSDVAAKHPDIVRKIAEIIRAEHRPSREFPLPALDGLK